MVKWRSPYKSRGNDATQQITYYSDFVVYPITVIALTAVNVNHVTWHSGWEWLAACLVGLTLWTFLEYVIHRIALHRMPVFSPMHSLHHGAPLAYIGTPSWVSVTVWLSVILLPVVVVVGIQRRGRSDRGGHGRLLVVRLRASRHPSPRPQTHARPISATFAPGTCATTIRPKRGNFGVTTSLWDHVFGTAISTQSKAIVSS